MKILFTKEAKDFRYGGVVDWEKPIFVFDHKYYNIKGEEVPKTEIKVKTIEEDDAEWDEYFRETEGQTESIKAESIIEPEHEIDDIFGKYGFKNENGEFVIEPQYAFAHEFTNGLAAVNLNRTWYKTVDGHKYYENHWGYIDTNGKTVIGFNYDYATPFNKYGVALVSNVHEDYRLIDMQGNEIEGSHFPYMEMYFSYSERYLEFLRDGSIDSDLIGLYDTKERKVLFEPKYTDIHIENDNCFRATIQKNGKEQMIYINRKEEVIYPWLLTKSFYYISGFDVNNIAAVGTKSILEIDGKNESKIYYGLYSLNGKMLLPEEYDHILHYLDDIWLCYKDKSVTVIQTESSDNA